MKRYFLWIGLITLTATLHAERNGWINVEICEQCGATHCTDFPIEHNCPNNQGGSQSQDR